jgi:hypothetical protein
MVPNSGAEIHHSQAAAAISKRLQKITISLCLNLGAADCCWQEG